MLFLIGLFLSRTYKLIYLEFFLQGIVLVVSYISIFIQVKNSIIESVKLKLDLYLNNIIKNLTSLFYILLKRFIILADNYPSISLFLTKNLALYNSLMPILKIFKSRYVIYIEYKTLRMSIVFIIFIFFISILVI